VENRIAHHKQEEQQRIEQERERIRAEEQRKAEQQAAAQREAEAVPQAESPARATTPAPSEQPQRQTYTASAAPRHKKPSDAEIIGAVAQAFRVSDEAALRWISEIDFTAQRQAL